MRGLHTEMETIVIPVKFTHNKRIGCFFDGALEDFML